MVYLCMERLNNDFQSGKVFYTPFEIVRDYYTAWPQIAPRPPCCKPKHFVCVNDYVIVMTRQFSSYLFTFSSRYISCETHSLVLQGVIKVSEIFIYKPLLIQKNW